MDAEQCSEPRDPSVHSATPTTSQKTALRTLIKCYIIKTDALLDPWCLQRILGISWYDFIRNADVRHMTNQPPLSSNVKSRRLSFFRHLVRMHENADDNQVICEPPHESRRRPPGWPCTTWMKTIQGDLSSLDLELHEARELAQNPPLWRLMSLYSATHS